MVTLSQAARVDVVACSVGKAKAVIVVCHTLVLSPVWYFKSANGVVGPSGGSFVLIEATVPKAIVRFIGKDEVVKNMCLW